MSIATETPKKLGHPLGFWFFFWGEFAERCSYYGMRSILAMYMADQLGLGQANSGTYFSFFVAACYLLPLVGGWVADRFVGKYWTITGFSIPYILGHVILGFENIPCLVIAMCLLAMGSGVIKPNISTLMGLTYDQERPGQEQMRSDAFAMFYFAINVGACISQLAMPPLRTNYGYAIAFMFPAVLMVIAFGIFAAGKKHYAREVIVHKEKTPAERKEQWLILGRVFGLFLLVMFFWAVFDQASSTWIFFTNSCMNRHVFGYEVDAEVFQAVNPFLILVLLPPITLLYKVLAKKGINVRATDKMGAGFVLTAICTGVIAFAAWLAGTAELRPNVVEPKDDEKLELVVEGSNPVKEKGKIKANATLPGLVKISYQTQDKTDVTMTITSDEDLELVKNSAGKMIVQGKIAKVVMKTKAENEEAKTKEIEGVRQISLAGELNTTETWFVPRKDLVTVWWLVLAYFLITIAEVLVSVTGLELAYTAAPKHMTGFVTAGWLFTVFLANFLINAPVTRLYTKIQPMDYFGGLTILMFVVSIAFVFVAKRFNRNAPTVAPDVSEAVTEAV